MNKCSNPNTQLQVFPNPANNTINVLAEGIDNENCSMTLENIIGQIKVLNKTKIENNFLQETIQVSEFPNGIYFLIIETEKERIVRKLVVQNQ